MRIYERGQKGDYKIDPIKDTLIENYIIKSGNVAGYVTEYSNRRITCELCLKDFVNFNLRENEQGIEGITRQKSKLITGYCKILSPRSLIHHKCQRKKKSPIKSVKS